MAQKEKRQASKPTVVSSNDLVHAKYNMTLWQKRLFAYAISQLGRDSVSFGWQRIYYRDLLVFFEAGGGKKAYDAIRQAPKELEMSIEVPYRDEQGNLRYAFLKLLSGYTLPADEVERNQYVEIRFNDDLRPHLLELRERFMGYSLDSIKKLRSTYSIRIFELMKSHEFRREVELEVDYLRDILQLKDTYKLYSDFKRNVIDKAQSDMTKHCDITFEYEEIKRSNRVTSILFFIKTNRPGMFEEQGDGEQKMVAPVEKQDQIAPKLRETIQKEWGVSAATLGKLLAVHGVAAIEQAARVTKRKLQKGSLENIAGFFTAAVRDGFEDLDERKRVAHSAAEAKTRRIAEIKAELEASRQACWKRIYEVVHQITAADSGITENAMRALRVSASPLVRGQFSTIEPGATLGDIRQNRQLLDLVVDEIIRQNPQTFQDVNAEFRDQQQVLLDEMRLLGAGK